MFMSDGKRICFTIDRNCFVFCFGHIWEIDTNLYQECQILEHLINHLSLGISDFRSTILLANGEKKSENCDVVSFFSILNPKIMKVSENDKFSLWDDCMSFPDLLVKVMRFRNIAIDWMDENLNKHSWYHLFSNKNYDRRFLKIQLIKIFGFCMREETF